MLEYPKKQIPLSFKSGDNKTIEYKCNFPNTGQLLDIQSELSRLLGGRVKSVLESGTNDAFYAYSLACAIASFKVLLPEFVKDVEDIESLDAIEGARILSVYVKQYEPWYREWRTILQNGGELVEKKEDKNE
jgi:hypothetical protein